jgi:hypothetical protein
MASKELSVFKKHFQENCSVHIYGTIEEQTYPHWKRLMFGHLNCEELEDISKYIRKTFSKEGLYSHKLPKIQCYKDELCLTVDIKDIKEFIIDKNQ